MNLAVLLKKDNIFIREGYQDTDNFYNDFSFFLKRNEIINNNDKVKRLFIKRENVQSTAIGKGAAAPHIFSDEFAKFTFCMALIKNGIDFKAPDEKKVFLVFLIMSDEREVGSHLKALAHIARLVSSTDIVEAIKKTSTPDEVLTIFKKKDQLI
ncbi:MAG: PTS sugar transporter subunit IIA [Candidatus Aminicenantes bacterium]|nr:PTS sugar transporter subunit IIA [Candidatus Aminicenantes bacterium]